MRVDDAHRIRVAIGDVEPSTALIPCDAGRVAADGNDFGDRARDQIDACHAPGLRDAPGIDAHQLRERITALLGGTIARASFRAAEIGDIGDRAVRTHDGSHRQHAQRNGLQQCAAIGVEDRQGIVGRQRNDHHTVSGRVRQTRHGRRSDDVVAEGR